jgi:hypothetical protein
VVIYVGEIERGRGIDRGRRLVERECVCERGEEEKERDRVA